MSTPLILYGLLPIENPRFEDDANGAAPSGWDSTGSVNPDQSVSTAEYQSPGPGLPSTRSLRQNVTDATGGNVAKVRQRFQPTALLEYLKAEGGELALAGVVKGALPLGLTNATVVLAQYQGGTSTLGSGTPLAAPASRSWVEGGPTWSLKLTAQELHADAEWIEVELRYTITAGYDAGADAYWDRVYCGGICDLWKRPRSWRSKVSAGFGVNRGDAGAVEVVRVRRPRSEIDAVWTDLLVDSDDEVALSRFVRWAETDAAGLVAVWRDRDLLTNASGHVQRAVLDPDYKLEFPRGVLRRDYGLRFLATSEGAS